MGKRTITFCDFCKEEFGYSGHMNERLTIKLMGDRYTDAAGSGDNNLFGLEMHRVCWYRFIEVAKRFADAANSLG